MKTPLRVRLWKSAVPECAGESVNLSQRGIYFATDSVLRKGETVEVFFNMPEEIVGEPASEWRCTGHVVRVEEINSPDGKQGVGVQFDCYEVSRSTPVHVAIGAGMPVNAMRCSGTEAESNHRKTSDYCRRRTGDMRADREGADLGRD